MNDERSNSYRHILKYTSVFGSVQGLNILSALARNKVAAIFLGPEGMGLASLLSTTANFLTQTAGLGISVSAVRHVSACFEEGDEEKILHFVRVVRVWCMMAALLGTLLSVCAGYWILVPSVVFMIMGGGDRRLARYSSRSSVRSIRTSSSPACTST